MSAETMIDDIRVRGRELQYSTAFALLAVLAYVVPGAAWQLGYHRALTGELWRAFTCHWAHWNFDHFLWSTGTFAVLAFMCERENRKQFLSCLALSALAIPLALWFLMPGLVSYGGLSGIDSALFMLIGVTLIREKARERQWAWVAGCALLLTGFLAKVAFEFYTDTTVFAQNVGDMRPVPLAHIVGGVVGVSVGLCAAWPKGFFAVGSTSLSDTSSTATTPSDLTRRKTPKRTAEGSLPSSITARTFK